METAIYFCKHRQFNTLAAILRRLFPMSEFERALKENSPGFQHLRIRLSLVTKLIWYKYYI